MDEKMEKEIVMKCPGAYNLLNENGQITEQGDAQLILTEESLSLMPEFNEPIYLSLRDILEISRGDYRIHLQLTSGETLTLFKFGYKYEDFLRNLTRLRNELLLRDMLMHETLRKSGVEAEYCYFSGNAGEGERGTCEVRLYETGMVLLPQNGKIIRIPYSEILNVSEADFTLTITTDWGEKVILSKMGRQLKPFTRTLSDLMGELALKTQAMLTELFPDVNPLAVRRASRLLKDGKAAKRGDLERISPQIWSELERKLKVVGIKDEYDFLKAMAQKEKICIGVKRGLLGDLTGEYIWFLIPIYSTEPEKPGNAIAMEATSGEGGGKATYFFRIVSRGKYPKYTNIEDLHREADRTIEKINRCMIAINFRREPIYLPEDRLMEPQYQKYQFAISMIPELQVLRKLFIGRVVHSTWEQWKDDVLDLLRFNVSIKDDEVKWKRGVRA